MFTLKWNNHENNLVDAFKSLLSTEEMVDVTLACDGRTLKAHKLVLSACSPFFRSLFLENPCKHPIVILKDVKYAELKDVIQFIYHGEVNVSKEQLSAFKETVKSLGVKGLTNKDNSSILSEKSSYETVIKTNATPERRNSLVQKQSSNLNNGGNSRKILSSDSVKIEQVIPNKDVEILKYAHVLKAGGVQNQFYPIKCSFDEQPKQQQHSFQNAGGDFPPIESFSVVSSKLSAETLNKDFLAVDGSFDQSCMLNMEIQTCLNTDEPEVLIPIFTPSGASAVEGKQPECFTNINPEPLGLYPHISPAVEPTHVIEQNWEIIDMNQSNLSILKENASTNIPDESAHITEPRANVPSARNKILMGILSERNQNNNENSEINYRLSDSAEIEEIINYGEAQRLKRSHISSIVAMQTPSRPIKYSFDTQSELQQEQTYIQDIEESFPLVEDFSEVLSELVEETSSTGNLPRRLDQTCVQLCKSGMEIQTCMSIDHLADLVPVFIPSDASDTVSAQPGCSTGINRDISDLVPLISRDTEPSLVAKENCMAMHLGKSNIPDLSLQNDPEVDATEKSAMQDFALNFENTVMNERHMSSVLPKAREIDKKCSKPKCLRCRYCSYSTAYSTTLKNHMRIHTEEKSYVCKLCGKTFSQRSNLRLHARVHTSDMTYACSFCT